MMSLKPFKNIVKNKSKNYKILGLRLKKYISKVKFLKIFLNIEFKFNTI